MGLKLIDDASLVLKRAWSVRLALLSAAFGAMEVALPYFQDFLPPHTMAVLAIVSSAGAAIARIVDQPKTMGGVGD